MIRECLDNLKKKYVFAIEETIVQEFTVYAENSEEAFEIAEKKYNSGEFVLEPGEVHYKQMAVISPEDEATEWVEF